MKASLLLFATLLHCIYLQAQNLKSITIPAGSKIGDVLSTADILYYPQFMAGTVYLRSGAQAQARLNYNSLFDEMHFINAKGDTLALADEKDVQAIVITADTFYYNKGYLRLLSSSQGIKLAEKAAWSLVDSRLTQSFNTSGSTAAISSYTSYHAAGSRYGLTVNEDLHIRKSRQYFIGDAYNHFVPANKKGVMTLFSKKQQQIASYLKEAGIDFTQRADLEKLLQEASRL